MNNNEVIEVNYDGDLNDFEVYSNGDYIGTIHPANLSDAEACRKELNEKGISCVTDWEDGFGNKVSFDSESEFAEFWKGDRLACLV